MELRPLLWGVLISAVMMTTVACASRSVDAGRAACPEVGFVVVEPEAVRRLTTTRDIADIELKDWYGDAQIRLQFTPAAAQSLHDATTGRSGMRLAFLVDEDVLLSVVWEGPYGVPVDGSQLHIKSGIRRARKVMEALHGCTAGTVRDESR